MASSNLSNLSSSVNPQNSYHCSFDGCQAGQFVGAEACSGEGAARSGAGGPERSLGGPSPCQGAGVADLLATFHGSRVVSAGSGAGSSYLDSMCQNGAYEDLKKVYSSLCSLSLLRHNSKKKHKILPFSRKQKRTYQRLISFVSASRRLTSDLKMVGLTTPLGGDKDLLRKHHQELIRRVERVYRCEIIQAVVSTGEGNGVLHLIWAITSKRGLRRVYIPFAWLKQQWLSIHGAIDVFIKPIGDTQGDSRRLSFYYVNQYYAGQSKFERFSYSYRKLDLAIGRAWVIFKRKCREHSSEWILRGENSEVLYIDRKALFLLWDELLSHGVCDVLGHRYVVLNRVPVELPYSGR